ncbi:hypothetical protein ACH5BF_07790 [Arcobacter sp. YIC-464]|uniref:hypothetical protein n=1 Tax=Arcobacter sp. YIC-464 TaxID=3376631 RepID=UPI003C2466E7
MLYVFTKPAFVQGAPVDHTFVTSYDITKTKIKTIANVINRNEHFWFCHGDFYSQGTLIGQSSNLWTLANCLVTSNTKNGKGSIYRYARDGVCHQVTNQVLYNGRNSHPSRIVQHAKGYKLTSLLYGTFGRNLDDWNVIKNKCILGRSYTVQISLLLSRARYAYKYMGYSYNNADIQELEYRRLKLLETIDEIDGASLKSGETNFRRASELNNEINEYLRFASQHLDEKLYRHIFGITPYEEINIIDSSLYKIEGNKGD